MVAALAGALEAGFPEGLCRDVWRQGVCALGCICNHVPEKRSYFSREPNANTP